MYVISLQAFILSWHFSFTPVRTTLVYSETNYEFTRNSDPKYLTYQVSSVVIQWAYTPTLSDKFRDNLSTLNLNTDKPGWQLRK